MEVNGTTNVQVRQLNRLKSNFIFFVLLYVQWCLDLWILLFTRLLVSIFISYFFKGFKSIKYLHIHFGPNTDLYVMAAIS